jgi:hypothetical protein
MQRQKSATLPRRDGTDVLSIRERQNKGRLAVSRRAVTAVATPGTTVLPEAYFKDSSIVEISALLGFLTAVFLRRYNKGDNESSVRVRYDLLMKDLMLKLAVGRRFCFLHHVSVVACWLANWCFCPPFLRSGP